MRVSVLQENLQKALGTCIRAIASRPSLQILGNVKLSTENGRLKLSATNLELAISVWIGAKIEEDGAITLPARLFHELTSNLSPERVDLELNSRTQTVMLRCGGNTNNIKGIDAAEYPLIPDVDTDAGIAVPAREFRRMVDQVVFAAAKDDNRPVLTGVLIKFDQDSMTMAAADGYRLAVRKIVLEETVKEATSLIVPAKNLQEVARIAQDDDTTLWISVSEERNQVMFHFPDVDIVSNTIDGKFPEYEGIIPDGYTTATTVYTQDLLKACKRAEVFAKDNSNTSQLEINPPDDNRGLGLMRVKAQTNEKGDNESIVDATIEGPAIQISFNIKYLIDVLSVISEDQAVIETNGPSDPGLIRPMVHGEEDTFIHVIMPMRGG